MINEHVYEIAPSVGNAWLTRSVFGRDQDGLKQHIKVVEERPLTIGDYPEFLAIGRMRGQRFICLSGEECLGRDPDPRATKGEPKQSACK